MRSDSGVIDCQHRLHEADHHIESGHFRSAVESASGGVELMLPSLFNELLIILNDVDYTLKLTLEARHKRDRKCWTHVVWNHRHSSELPNERDVEDAYRFITEEPDSDSWYEIWRERVQDWVFENLNAEIGDVIFVVPDLFILIARLIRDNRVPATVKERLAATTSYVVSPFDQVPESLLGVVGLADDAGALALIGYWLVNVIEIDREILQCHWPGTSDPVTVIEELHSRIHANAESIFDGKIGIWRNILQRFGNNQYDEKFGLLERIRQWLGKGS